MADRERDTGTGHLHIMSWYTGSGNANKAVKKTSR